MSVRIVIDSTADTSAAVREKCTVVPLGLFFGEEEYVDGVTITHEEFYKKLVEGDVMPTTSQPTPDAFGKVFKEAVKAGDQVVVITIASKLSGTYQSACIAAMDYPDSVFVVDSESATMGTGILAELALSLAESGMSAAQIAQRLTEERDNICLFAMLDTLEYLKRGGRISKTVAFAGELLSIKPIINVKDGEVNVLGKARGAKQANNMLVKLIQENGVDFDKPILLGYTGMDASLLEKFRTDSANVWEGLAAELDSTTLGTVIGTHAGPGAVAAAFFKKN